MSKQPIVRLQDVTKKIGGKTIIDRLSFELYPGEVVGFLGPNGAGKTTTIRMIVGLMSPTEGQILIQNIDIRENFEAAIQYVGAIVENPELYKYMTGYQNLLHYARMVDGVTDERIHEVIELVGLEWRIEQRVRTYSLGMRQRLGLAQALLHRPRLLILDEPTNGLDPAGIREFRDYLRRIAREENVCVLVSSHLLTEMELMCDRTLIIQGGKLIGEQQARAKEEKCFVRFEVSPLTTALSVLEVSPIQSDEQSFTVEIVREEIPNVIQQLVAANVAIFSVEPQMKSLEDEFLEMTGGRSVE
jgi:ABC-2 type transport system ATP-binding protein